MLGKVVVLFKEWGSEHEDCNEFGEDHGNGHDHEHDHDEEVWPWYYRVNNCPAITNHEDPTRPGCLSLIIQIQIQIQTQIQIQKYKYIHICRNMKIHPPQTAQWHSSQRKTSPITYLKYQSSSSSKSYLVNIIQIIIFINIQIIISIIISSLFSLLFSSTWLAATPRLSLTIFRWKLCADLKWLKSETHSTFWPQLFEFRLFKPFGCTV